jgi:hypothetical protein
MGSDAFLEVLEDGKTRPTKGTKIEGKLLKVVIKWVPQFNICTCNKVGIIKTPNHPM